MDRLGHLLHTCSKVHYKRELASSQLEVSEYKSLGLGK